MQLIGTKNEDVKVQYWSFFLVWSQVLHLLANFVSDVRSVCFCIFRHSFDSDILKIENSGNNEANIYLNKELDREIKDEYSIVLTLTDNRLGEGNFVTQSLLLLVEDINDNEPIFKPYQSALEVPENSRPGVLTTVEATDRDEGAYGQVSLWFAIRSGFWFLQPETFSTGGVLFARARRGQ